VERAFDAGAVVGAEIADVVDHKLEVLFGHLSAREDDFAARVARLWEAPEVHHDFEEVHTALALAQRFDDVRRQRFEQQIEVVRNDLFGGQGWLFSWL
jgi:hypothetical protein